MKRALISLFLFLTTACVPPPPPVDPPQPPEPVRLIQATIRTPSGEEPQNLVASLSTDAPYTIACNRAADIPRIICTLDSGFPVGGPGETYGATLIVSAKGYVAHSERLLLTGRSMDLPDIFLEEEFKPLPRIGTQGRFFYVENRRFTYLEGTDFNLYSRFLSGEDLSSLLDQRKEAGIQVLRVFTAYNICPSGCAQPIGRLVPSEHPDFYSGLTPFANLVAKHGLYLELVALTGPYDGVLNSDNDKVLHWNSLKAAVAPLTNVQLELINEWNNTPNRIPDSLYDVLTPPPSPTLASRGSGIQDSDPKTPGWSYLTWHPSVSGEVQRKPGHNGWEVSIHYNLPLAVNEMVRYPDGDSSLTHAFDMGAGCKFFGVPCTFHSVSGKASLPFSTAELGFAKAMRAGMDSVPDYCATGRYVHRTDLEGPDVIRAYEMTGVGPGCIHLVRR